MKCLCKLNERCVHIFTTRSTYKVLTCCHIMSCYGNCLRCIFMCVFSTLQQYIYIYVPGKSSLVEIPGSKGHNIFSIFKCLSKSSLYCNCLQFSLLNHYLNNFTRSVIHICIYILIMI